MNSLVPDQLPVTYLRRMKCVIVGSGWLGLPLAENLSSSEMNVAVSYRSTRPKTAVPAFAYPGPEALNFLKNADVVVLAFPPSRQNLTAYRDDCLEIIGQCKPGTRFILTSSTSVYSDDKASMTEETPISPENTGNERILLAENALLDHAKGKATIVRLGGLIGPGRYPVTAMSRTGKQYAGDEPVNVIHLEDAVGLIRFVIEENIYGVLNACAPEHPTKEAYYTWMAKQLGGAIPDLSVKNGGGKTINAEKAIALGYRFQKPDPFSFI